LFLGQDKLRGKCFHHKATEKSLRGFAEAQAKVTTQLTQIEGSQIQRGGKPQKAERNAEAGGWKKSDLFKGHGNVQNNTTGRQLETGRKAREEHQEAGKIRDKVLSLGGEKPIWKSHDPNRQGGK